ncbi:hypothetical protein K9M41_00545 [Candidatus Gracilibacteria bacterium]|nr:hypothetical protein [Candidatus Gracilibacteria bacterium]
MKNLTLEKKVDIIFSYLFGEEGIQKEEDFWNKLTPKEVARLEKIEKEELFDFEDLKKKYA